MGGIAAWVGGLHRRWRLRWPPAGGTAGLPLPVGQHAAGVDGVGMVGTHGGGERGDPAGPAVTVVGRAGRVAGKQELRCGAGVSDLEVVMWRRGCPVILDTFVGCSTARGCRETALSCDKRLVGPHGRYATAAEVGDDRIQQGAV
jgi:hypothetical protein